MTMGRAQGLWGSERWGDGAEEEDVSSRKHKGVRGYSLGAAHSGAREWHSVCLPGCEYARCPLYTSSHRLPLPISTGALHSLLGLSPRLPPRGPLQLAEPHPQLSPQGLRNSGVSPNGTHAN